MTATPITSLVLAGLIVGFVSASLPSDPETPSSPTGFSQEMPTPPDQPLSGPGGKD